MLYSGSKILSAPFESSSKKKKKDIDRFIPHSVTKNLYSLFEEASLSEGKCQTYSSMLGSNLLHQNKAQGKVLHFTDDQASENKENLLHQQNRKQKVTTKRQSLRTQPYKILDAPYLRDDFYLNLVDWSDSGNIGVGLQASIYVWSGCMSKVKKIYQADDASDYVCSIGFLKDGNKVCSGFTDGKVKIFDTHKSHAFQEFEGLHFGRIGSIGCTNNLICTGGRDGYVSIQDVRMETEIMRYKAHNQEICGLKICPSGELIATGGNDNRLFLYSMRKMGKLACWGEHTAAVKAIGFNPKEPTVASGGGTADRKIRIFSLQTLELMNEVDTGSQICNLMYSPVSRELVTTHGYSLNQINVWKWGSNGSIQKIESLMGHRSRVLYLAGESAGGKIITGAGDEELRLWKIFDENEFSIPYDLR